VVKLHSRTTASTSGARVPGFASGLGDSGMARSSDRDSLSAFIGVRPGHAVRCLADADLVAGNPVLVPGFGSASVLGDPVRMVVVKGAGPISVDALIGRGIAATALPLARTITRIFEALSRWGDRGIKLLLRCWIAVLFFRPGLMKISNFDMTQMLFHVQSAQELLPRLWPPVWRSSSSSLSCLFGPGVGKRIIAIVLIGLSALLDPTYQKSIDLAYYLMVLSLIGLRGPGTLSIDDLVVHALKRRFPSAYRRHLRRTPSANSKPGPAFEIDPGRLAEEARYDGPPVLVLRTNARITPLQAVWRYRDL
jgi:hypothetical protein